jgi:hypothetical protein
MRGRTQACGVAFFGFLFPFVSSAVIGLVTLRKGFVEGSLVTLWSLLPVLLSYFFSQSNPFLAVVTGTLVLTSLVVAEVLRKTANWDHTLVSGVVVSAGLSLLAGVLFPIHLGAFVEWVTEFFKIPASGDVLALLSMGVTVNAVCGLLIARWWQSLLFNPNGFQKEFHSTRLDPKIGAGCFMMALLGSFGDHSYLVWFQLASLPLLFCGVGFVHYAVKKISLGKVWLGLMYISIFLGPMTVVLVGLGMVDSVLDLRTRMAKLS